MFISLKQLLLLASLAATISTASATNITFEEFPHTDELQGAGNLLQSKGFNLAYAPAAGEPYSVGFTTVGPSWRFNKRSAAMVANSCGATTTLTAQDNNPLTLTAIDLAGLNGDTDVTVTFVGITAEGKTVQHHVKLSRHPGWQTIDFPHTFKNLQRVTWVQGDCIINKPHMFDNIHLHPSWKGPHGN